VEKMVFGKNKNGIDKTIIIYNPYSALHNVVSIFSRIIPNKA
jgi:hypothetical protein